jgi:DNA-directed RNA polymerase specialized sigma24 family protein
MPEKPDEGLHVFPTTHWSVVLAAGPADSTTAQKALGGLLTKYMAALKAHLGYKFPSLREEADDLFQSFVHEKILEKHLLERASRERGRFRTFILNALDNFVIDQLRFRDRQKRKGQHVELEEVPERELAGQQESHADPGDLLWARSVVAQAVELMRAECDRKQRRDLWELFDSRVLQPLLNDKEPVPYPELVPRLKLKSAEEASNLLITARRMFARALESIVPEYAEGETEAELAELKAILASASQTGSLSCTG